MKPAEPVGDAQYLSKRAEELEMSNDVMISHHSPPRQEEVDVIPQSLEPASCGQASQPQQIEEAGLPRPVEADEAINVIQAAQVTEELQITEPQVWQQTPDRDREEGNVHTVGKTTALVDMTNHLNPKNDGHEFYPEVKNEDGLEAAADDPNAANATHVEQMIRQFGGEDGNDQ